MLGVERERERVSESRGFLLASSSDSVFTSCSSLLLSPVSLLSIRVALPPDHLLNKNKLQLLARHTQGW